MVDHFDPESGMSAMMRTTAFPASIVLQMLASGKITKRGAVLQERDVPVDLFLDEVARRGIRIDLEGAEARKVVAREPVAAELHSS
jgi:lysine 6-dehydrogenase